MTTNTKNVPAPAATGHEDFKSTGNGSTPNTTARRLNDSIVYALLTLFVDPLFPDRDPFNFDGLTLDDVAAICHRAELALTDVLELARGDLDTKAGQ